MTTKNFDELLKALQATEEQADATTAALPENLPPEGDGEDEGAPAVDTEDDEAIAAAAAEAEKAKDDGQEFGKSFEAVDADGNPITAVDATELIKSLVSRQSVQEDVLAKAMGAMTSLLSKQGDLIKSLSEQVKTVASQGRGRKAVLSVNEKPSIDTLAKSAAGQEDGGMKPQEFFAKANTAFDEGKLSGLELNVINVSLRENQPLDESLIKKVMG